MGIHVHTTLNFLGKRVIQERERERERDRQTDRQTDRDRDRQTDRQTDRERVAIVILLLSLL